MQRRVHIKLYVTKSLQKKLKLIFTSSKNYPSRKQDMGEGIQNPLSLPYDRP